MKKLATLAGLTSLVVGIGLISAGCGAKDDAPSGAQLSEPQKTTAGAETPATITNDSPKGIPGGPGAKRSGG